MSSMDNKLIPGILDCKNKTIFGINKNSNTPLVIFTPHDSSLPKFLIPTKLKYKNVNFYAVIKFFKNDDKYRFPIGNIIYTIGQVGDYQSHCEYILHIHELNIKEPKLSKNQMKKIKKSVTIWDIIKKTDIPTYKDYRSATVFSIDPKDSTDIDDAISFSNDILSIHIADVTFWLKKFNVIPSFFSTIYLPHRKINMIPSILADHLCSLKQNQDRLALTFNYNIKTKFFYYEDTIINVNRNFTYENFPTNNNLFLLSKEIGHMYNMDIQNWDTHKMIEAFMVLANNKTAEYLKTHNHNLFRIHEEKFHKYNLSNITNSKFLEFMKIYLSNSAIYSENPGKHYGLDLDLYTHFTSPIRRMADVYVHLMIKEEPIKINFEELNNSIQKTRKLKRDIEKYNVISNLIKPIETDGYIVNFENDIITCYFPEINLCDKFDLIPRRLNDIVTKTYLNEQRAKIKLLGNIRVTIAKKNNELIYNLN